MYNHLAMYSASLGSVTDSDVTAALDTVLTRRNGHLILTEDFDLVAAYGTGTTLARARFGSAALSQIGNNHLWPLERSATITDIPAIIDYRDSPLRLPQNEEITILATTDAVGPARVEFALWLAAQGWSRTYPPHLARLKTRATVTITAGAEGAWTALAEPTFERDLLNGVYAVVNAELVAPNAVAFRLRFPDQPNVNGKQLRPGKLVTNALGDDPGRIIPNGLGEWGRFHTFSPPEVEVFGDSAGGTYELRLDLLYLGRDESLLIR